MPPRAEMIPRPILNLIHLKQKNTSQILGNTKT
jgi:hypothetical protein